ncbi:MAG: hypothetical protein QME81_09110 [bacterium]|nr:hypothetical protein [bacterium]
MKNKSILFTLIFAFLVLIYPMNSTARELTVIQVNTVRTKLTQDIREAERIVKESQSVEALQVLDKARNEVDAAITAYRREDIETATVYLRSAFKLIRRALYLAGEKEQAENELEQLRNIMAKAKKAATLTGGHSSSEARWLRRAEDFQIKAENAFARGYFRRAIKFKQVAFNFANRVLKQSEDKARKSIEKEIKKLSNLIRRTSQIVKEDDDTIAYKLVNQAKDFLNMAKQAARNGDMEAARHNIRIGINLAGEAMEKRVEK